MITVGYGDINPQNNIEIVICSIAMMIACGVFAYAVNSVGTIFQEFFAFEKELKYNMNVINTFMANKKISRKLQEQIQQYLDYYWREQLTKNSDLEQKIINQLSDNLKEQLLMEANKQILINTPIFKTNFSENIIPRIIPLIKELHYTPNEKIFDHSDIIDNQIYFIEKGKVEICINYRNPCLRKEKAQTKMYQLTSGDNFGELGFFTGLGRNFTIITQSFCSLLTIKRADFIQLLQEFPEDYEKFCYIRDMILYQNDYQKLGLKCFCCLKQNHLIDQCPIIHYIPNKFKTIYNESIGAPQFHRQKCVRKNNKAQHKNKTRTIQDDALNFVDDYEDIIDLYIKQNINYDSDNDEEQSDDKLPYLTNEKENLQEKKVKNTVYSGKKQNKNEIYNKKLTNYYFKLIKVVF
ncbi:hypothetical protein IMG5_062490 [Ichthyophthirius multifiliis]|uniref:Cyclic nucleotide-binding domain-containing protein n=1 Tax=Ichthyophthirius multifiliis TaxID=5932 RepID=G0QNY4_ICHMU|nr:hypothetical protein IMG5_062490 [Ichthyophthirius multifiliis]EGR33071.1 hypothetical protein IMG5_062490 [Ichthyophthirius multifiliis]|eukprot:XP_004037057.1 hypothetical protein IMG5_062490 [Ichthyophthirius multifiliis]